MSFAPLMRKELVGLARKRRWFVVRPIIAAIVLVVTVLLFVEMWETRRGTPIANAATRSFWLFAWIQIFLLTLPAPAFGVGALDEARGGSMLDLLRLASIPRPLLAFGKLLGAGTWPVLLAVSQLPFLVLWSLWGGIVLVDVLTVVALTAALGLVLAGFGLVSGSLTKSIAPAFGLAYLFTAAFLAIPIWIQQPWHPLIALFNRTTQRPAGLGFGPEYAVGVSLAIALTCALAAGLVLRLRDRGSARRERKRRHRTVWRRGALIWRELRARGRRMTWFVWGTWIVCAGLLIAAVIAKREQVAFVWWLIAFPVLPAVVITIAAGSSVSTEKESGTLGPLLLLPRGSRSIVMAKLWAVLINAAPLVIVPLLGAFVYTIKDVFDEPVVYFVMLTPILHLVQIAAFGVLCSTVFRRTALAISITVVGSLIQTLGFFFLFMWLAVESGVRLNRDEAFLGMLFVWDLFTATLTWFWVFLSYTYFERLTTRSI